MWVLWVGPRGGKGSRTFWVFLPKGHSLAQEVLGRCVCQGLFDSKRLQVKIYPVPYKCKSFLWHNVEGGVGGVRSWGCPASPRLGGGGSPRKTTVTNCPISGYLTADALGNGAETANGWINTGWNWGPNWTSELQQWPFKCEVGNRQGGALQLKWPRMQVTHVRSNPASVPSPDCAGESGCQGGSCRGLRGAAGGREGGSGDPSHPRGLRPAASGPAFPTSRQLLRFWAVTP